MAGKPTGTLGETVIWDSNTIAVYLAGLYLRTNQINETTDNSKACELLLEHELSCEITYIKKILGDNSIAYYNIIFTYLRSITRN